MTKAADSSNKYCDEAAFEGVSVLDSRRLTGPNILWRLPSAVLDIELPPDRPAQRLVDAWNLHVEQMLEKLGWQEQTAHRRFVGGLSLALSAPIDCLYAATEINEWAWAAAVASAGGPQAPSLPAAADRLSAMIRDEQNLAARSLRAAALEHRVAFLWDDDHVSIGMGTGSQIWPNDEIPPAEEVDWAAVHDIPLALVTGTNGKTTTVRLLAAMVRAADKIPGISSTDGVWVDGECVDGGDYSGPGGARAVLRDPRTEIAILETARGGMLRRGLGVERADVALVTNVAEDHLGEWGIHDLGELADTKMMVGQVADRLILNLDDPELVSRSRSSTATAWFSMQPVPEQGPECPLIACLDSDSLTLRTGPSDNRQTWLVATVDEIPMTVDGAARHNIANALGAIAVAESLSLPRSAVVNALRAFDSSASENPGRLNRFDLAGVNAIVDFAHNPHGVDALMSMAAAIPAKRRLVLVGQAGDREDQAIRELAHLIWKHRPDRIIVKDLVENLRGRPAGEVPRMIASELHRLGAPTDAVGLAGDEMSAVREALVWATSGDLLLLICHEARAAVLDLLRHLRDSDWQPTDPVPAQVS